MDITILLLAKGPSHWCFLQAPGVWSKICAIAFLHAWIPHFQSMICHLYWRWFQFSRVGLKNHHAETKLSMPPRSHHDFLVKANSFELKQLVEEPTRFGPFNTLNLMLTNVPHRVNKTIIIPGISDHDIPLTELSQKPHYIKQMTDWLVKALCSPTD